MKNSPRNECCKGSNLPNLSREDEDKFDYYEVVFEPDDAPPLGLRTEIWVAKFIGNQMVHYHANW